MVEQPFHLRKPCLFKNINAKNDNAKSEAKKKSNIFVVIELGMIYEVLKTAIERK